MLKNLVRRQIKQNLLFSYQIHWAHYDEREKLFSLSRWDLMPSVISGVNSFSSTVNAVMTQISFNYYPIHVIWPAVQNEHRLSRFLHSLDSESTGKEHPKRSMKYCMKFILTAVTKTHASGQQCTGQLWIIHWAGEFITMHYSRVLNAWQTLGCHVS